MLLGLLSDIHEAVTPLAAALDRFRAAGVDEVLDLGDVVRMTDRLLPTVRLLADAGVRGVWGNHDYGLCQDPDPDLRRRYPGWLTDYFGRYRPSLVRDDCRFCHVEHRLDANDLFDLWVMDGYPTRPELLAASFDAVPQRVLFSGHVHRWTAATPDGPLEWAGERPLRLERPTRWYVTMQATCEGAAALYDTRTGEFTPLELPVDARAG
ncbi:MAG: metallophosphoesterase family protein [Gemmataceae bacterium]